jgi:hypothetical protein
VVGKDQPSWADQPAVAKKMLPITIFPRKESWQPTPLKKSGHLILAACLEITKPGDYMLLWEQEVHLELIYTL